MVGSRQAVLRLRRDSGFADEPHGEVFRRFKLQEPKTPQHWRSQWHPAGRIGNPSYED
jgi:hypothetical protein